MRKQFKAEFFRRDFSLLDAAVVADPEISFDYLTLETTSVRVKKTKAEQGDFIRISELYQADAVYEGIVQTAEQEDGGWTSLTIDPLLSLLDVEIFYPRWTDKMTEPLEAVLKNAVRQCYLGEDGAQKIEALEISGEETLTGWTLPTVQTILEEEQKQEEEQEQEGKEKNGRNTTPVNLWQLFVEAMKAYRLVCRMALHVARKKLSLEIFCPEEKSVVLETEQSYCLRSMLTIGSDYGSLNKIIYINENDPEEMTAYYRKTDGSINQDAETDRILPVVWQYKTVSVEEKATLEETAAKTAETDLAAAKFDNQIELEIRIGDCVVNPELLEIGSLAQIISGEKAYESILTGFTRGAETMTLLFGTIRSELTKKIMLERRKNNGR